MGARERRDARARCTGARFLWLAPCDVYVTIGLRLLVRRQTDRQVTDRQTDRQTDRPDRQSPSVFRCSEWRTRSRQGPSKAYSGVLSAGQMRAHSGQDPGKIPCKCAIIPGKVRASSSGRRGWCRSSPHPRCDRHLRDEEGRHFFSSCRLPKKVLAAAHPPLCRRLQCAVGRVFPTFSCLPATAAAKGPVWRPWRSLCSL